MPTSLKFEDWVIKDLRRSLSAGDFSALVSKAQQEPEAVSEVFMKELETLSNSYVLITVKPHYIHDVREKAKELTQALAACTV